MDRKEFESVFIKMMNPVEKAWDKFSEYGNHDSCHGHIISWFELFARSLYGVSPYEQLQNKGRIRNNKYSDKFNNILLNKILKSEYAHFQDYDQKAVELVPIALFVFANRESTWDAYDDNQKEKVTEWLNNINKIQLWKSNWIFFRILVNSTLIRLVRDKKFIESLRIEIKKDWEFIDSLYEDDGWYHDGENENKDYYIAFAFHYYSLMYLFFFSDDMDDRGSIIKERACKFAKEYILWFDNSGEAVAYGRSLIYRFANISFFSALIINHIYPIPLNQIKWLIEQNIKMWMGKNIFDSDGMLNLGYYYHNEELCEKYNSAGSPYWAFKAFSLFYLAEDDEFWHIEGEAISHGLILKPSAVGDHIILNNNTYSILFPNSVHNREYNGTAKYMKFAYCSKAGINLSENKKSILSDSTLSFRMVEDEWKSRFNNRKYKLSYKDGSYIQTYIWNCTKKILIKTKIVPIETGYICSHVILSLINCEAAVTGFTGIGAIENITEDNNDFKIKIKKSKMVGREEKIVVPEGINTNIKNETFIPVVYYKINKGYNYISNIIRI